MNAHTVADAVAYELAHAGVDRVFGLPGGEVLQLMDALRRRGIGFSLFRHEAHAGFAAGVYGKLKGTAGVVLSTLGPGACNLLLPVANSLLDREPLLAISATIPEAWPLSHTHQRLPLTQIFQSVTKFSGAIDQADCRPVIRAALAACTTEPAGSAFLTLAADQASARYSEEASGIVSHLGYPGPLKLSEPAAAAAAVRARLSASRRPLVIVGLGSDAKCAGRLRAWLREWSLPFGVTAKAKGLVDETDPKFVGVFGGMAVDRIMREAARHADLVVGFGLDPVEIDQTWHAEIPLLWVLESAWATGVIPEGAILASHEPLLEELLGQPALDCRDAFAEFREQRLEHLNSPPESGSSSAVSLVDMLKGLAAIAPDDLTVVTDVGSHKYLFGQFWPSRRPNSFLTSNGLSAMAYGLPAAIGARLARPESPVLLVTGDGGFSMSSQELETAVRLGANLVVLVLSDNSYSLIRLAQESRGLPNFGVDFGPIDSVVTAQACGIPAVRVGGATELVGEVSAAFAADSSLVVEVPVSPDDYRTFI